MKKSFLVIGLSRFGLSVVKSLTDLGAEVIAVDINEEAIKKVEAVIPIYENLKAIGLTPNKIKENEYYVHYFIK